MQRIATRSVLLAALVLGLSASTVHGEDRENVQFQITHATPDDTWSVFVLGDLPELGGNDLTRAVKLESSEDPLWKVTVSLPVNRSYNYQFYERLHGPNDIGNSFNGNPIGSPLAASTSTVFLLPVAKRVLYHSSINPPLLHWRQDDGAYQVVTMVEVGPGREPGELRWLACGFGEARRPVELYLTNVAETERDPANLADTYQTPLDAFFLQDENVFSYTPAPNVSPQRRDYVPANPPAILSEYLDDIDDGTDQLRPYRVMLPRGYDEHPDRCYPVLYWNDGIRAFDQPSGHDPDGAVMENLVRSGQVGEIIMVGIDVPEIDNSCSYHRTRVRDFDPSVDPENPENICGPLPACGQTCADLEAHNYVDFVLLELKPLIDAQYRTLPDAEHTFSWGFSLGGGAALYLGWDFPDMVSGIGLVSGGPLPESQWALAFKQDEDYRDIRIYLDSGTAAGTEAAVYTSFMEDYDRLISMTPQPYVVEGDLRYYVAFGQAHFAGNARTRLPNMMTFLYPATDEVNQLLCLADLDCSGAVGFSDLTALLSAWGPCPVPPAACPADFDGSGNVGFADLTHLLSAWGDCA